MNDEFEREAYRAMMAEKIAEQVGVAIEDPAIRYFLEMLLVATVKRVVTGETD